MAKRKNMICCMRNLERTSAPKNGCVGRGSEDEIYIGWTPVEGCTQYLTGMTSRDARLLARRINQFLDAGG